MKIVVTGASGHIGQTIVPKLLAAKADIVVVGRDDKKLIRLFPNCNSATYPNWPDKAQGADIIVHLANANPGTGLSAEELMAINIENIVTVAHQAKTAGIPRLINVSSFYTLDERQTSAYALSKREETKRLQDVKGLKTVTVFLPAFYDTRFSGKLAPLNRVPGFAKRLLFAVVSAFKPVVHADRLVEQIMLVGSDKGPADIMLADNKDKNRFYTSLRRILDLGFAVFVVVFLNWALLLIWLSIRLESPGAALFKQERVGRHGKPFTLYKFRSMHLETREAATHEVAASAITRVGSFLRRTKLDELPQIWNLLRNEMSLIGPRPCLPRQHELIEERMKRGVLNMKPGITGLAQINAIDMSNPKQLAEWDATYMALRGLLLDMRILFATAFGRGQGDRTKGHSL